MHKVAWCDPATDIHQRYQLPIPPCVTASSAMGLNLGVFRFLPTTHAKSNAKQMRSWFSRATWLLTCDWLHAQTAVHAGNYNAPVGPQLFWLREKPEDPQIEPHVGIKMVACLVSLVYTMYICGSCWNSQTWIKARGVGGLNSETQTKRYYCLLSEPQRE